MDRYFTFNTLFRRAAQQARLARIRALHMLVILSLLPNLTGLAEAATRSHRELQRPNSIRHTSHQSQPVSSRPKLAYDRHETSAPLSLEGASVASLTSPLRIERTVVLQPDISLDDAFIAHDGPTLNFDESYLILGRTWGGSHTLYRTLLKFDVSRIPMDAVILSAAIKLTIVAGEESAVTRTYSAYRLLRPWAENQVTWNNYATGSAWQVAGGDGALDREVTASATTTIPSGTPFGTTITWSLSPSAVQGWVDGTFTNNGILIKMDVDDSAFGNWVFRSSNATGGTEFRPQLVLTYESDSTFVVGAPLQSGTVNANSEPGVTLSGLEPSAWYSLTTSGGPVSGTAFGTYDSQVSLDGTTWVSPWSASWIGFVEKVNTYHTRAFFQASESSVHLRVADTTGEFAGNGGSLGWSLSLAGAPPLPPSQAFATNECPFCNNSAKVYTAGQGINVHSGNYNHQHADGQVAGVGARLSFERSYNSLTSGANSEFPTYNDALGYGWTHNYNVRLILPADPGGESGVVKLIAPRGSVMQFTDNGDGTYSPFPAVLASLTRTDLGGGLYEYHVVTNSQYEYVFDDARRLVSIFDPQDHQTALTYTGSQLTQVQDASGTRRLKFFYNGSSRIERVDYVKVSGGETVLGQSTYTYTGDDLTSVTDFDGRAWTYQYNGPALHLLTAVIDAAGKRLIKTDFDTAGRATAQYDGLDNRITQVLNYTDPADRQVVTAAGATTTVTFSGGVPVAVDAPGNNDSQTQFVGQGINPGTVTDPNGNETTLTWSPGGGSLTGVIDALNNATSMQYDALNNLEQVTDDLGRITKYEYFTGTTLLQRAIGNYEDGIYESAEPDSDLITSYTYTDGSTGEPAGLLRTQTDPSSTGSPVPAPQVQAGQGLTTHFTYTALGQREKVTTNYVDGTPGPGDEDRVTSFTCYDDRGRVMRAIQYPSVLPPAVDICADYTPSTDPAFDHVTKNEYDASGNLFRVTRNYLAGQLQNYQSTYNLIAEYGYDAAGRLETTTDTLGQVSYTCYDDAGRLTKTVQNPSAADPCPGYTPSPDPALDRIATITYDANGNVIASTGPDGVVTRTYYDDLHRPIATIQNLSVPIETPLSSVPAWSDTASDQNVRSETVYDNAGNVQKTIDNAGRVTHTCYDALNRAIQTVQNPTAADPCVPYTVSTDPDKDIITQTKFDDVGNVIATLDPAVHVTRTYYDPLNRPFLVVYNLTLQGWEVATPPADSAFPGSPADENIATRMFYDSASRAFKTVDLNTGRADWTCYDSLGRVSRSVLNATVTDPCAPGLTHTGDTDENLITEYRYDPAGRHIGVIAPDLTVSRTYYDAAGRSIATTTNLVYRIGGVKQSIDDAIALAAPPTYDGMNHPDENLTTSYTYDALGRVDTATDNAGLVTHTCYDALGRAVKTIQNPAVSNPCGTYTASANPDEDVITVTTYDGKGDVIAVTNAEGQMTRIYYDALHRTRYAVENLSGQTIENPSPPAAGGIDENVRQEMKYDAAGRVFQLIDNSGMVTQTDYDLLDRGLAVIVNYVDGGPLDNQTNLTTETIYDKLGNVTDRQDPPLPENPNPNGIVTHFEYDQANRLIEVWENFRPLITPTVDINVRTEYTYDWHGNRLSIRDGNATLNDTLDKTTFTYDALDRLETETDPLNHTTTHTYSLAGAPATLLDANEQTTTYLYDGARRLKKIDYPQKNPDVSFTYGPVGNRLTMTDGTGTTTWLYDTVYRPLAIQQPNTSAVQYAYDKLDRRELLTYPGGKQVQYAFDGLNRPENVTPLGGTGVWGAGSGATSYTYRDFGALATTVLPNGATTTYEYDNAHHLTEISHETSSLALSTFTYALDKVGNRTSVTESSRQPNNSVVTLTVEYEYDPLYRLTEANYSDGRYVHYTYDAVGNRLTEEKCLTPGGCTTPIAHNYVYDAANRLASVNGQAYTWDDNGNLLDDGTNTYTYDAADRLIQVKPTTPWDNSYVYSYNGLGDRVSQYFSILSPFGSWSTQYVLDLNAGLTQVLAADTVSAWFTSTETYLYGNGRIGEQQASEFVYHLGDALGSVRQLADAGANVTLARSYEPYGSVLSSAGTGSTVMSFTGEILDNTGLQYHRARYYASSIGRFLTADTWPGSYIKLPTPTGGIGSDPNQFVADEWPDYTRPLTLNGWNYVEANPTNFTDPSGHQSIPAGGGLPGAQGNIIEASSVGGPCMGGYTVQTVIDFGRVTVQLVPCETERPVFGSPPLDDNCNGRPKEIGLVGQMSANHLSKQCESILKDIKKALATVQKRYNEWVINALGLKDTGHRRAYANAQTSLRQALDKWDRRNCGELPAEVADAPEWVIKPLPD